MGVRNSSVFSVTRLADVPASGASTVIMSTPALGLPFDGSLVVIFYSYNFIVGTGTTVAIVSIVRGTALASPTVYTVSNNGVTAGQTVTLTGMAVDANPGITVPQYSMICAGTGTTGAWAGGNVAMLAFVL